MPGRQGYPWPGSWCRPSCGRAKDGAAKKSAGVVILVVDNPGARIILKDMNANELTETMKAALACPSAAGKHTLRALERRGLVRISWKSVPRMVRNGRTFGCDYTERHEREMVVTLTDAGKAVL